MAMFENYQCPKCKKTFTFLEVKNGKCPDCKKWMNYTYSKDSSDESAEQLSNRHTEEYLRDELENLDSSTRALVIAANKTTYAIRSLAIFLFTTLCTSVLGYVLISAGASAALRCDSYSDCGSGFVIWGFVIVALGFIVGLGAGVNELGKSKP